MPTTDVQLSAGAATVAYELTGTGPAVVLVHGTSANRAQWAPLTAAIAGRYTVLALDYSGSGDTVDHGGALTVADLAAEVRAAADHAGLDRFHLVGHSLGAVIAAHVAATDPQRICSLLMHAGWVRTDSRMDAEFRYWIELVRTDAERGTTLLAQLLTLTAFGPGYWARTNAEDHAAVVKQFAGMIAPGATAHPAKPRNPSTPRSSASSTPKPPERHTLAQRPAPRIAPPCTSSTTPVMKPTRPARVVDRAA
jgi:pimeloyl-ACP methyl ester carboxylesterase